MSATDLFGNPASAPSPLAPGEKCWLPEFLFDEVSPSPRARPEDWLIAGIEQDFWITDTDNEESAILYLNPGDDIEFVWFRSFGTARLTIRPDGTWTSNASLPAEANGFADVDDVESMMDTPDAFARAWAANYFAIADDDGEVGVVVHVYQWSDPVTFRLTLGEDGTPRFEETSNG